MALSKIKERKTVPDPDLVTARFYDACVDCGETIEPGDLVSRDINDRGWNCEGCTL